MLRKNLIKPVIFIIIIVAVFFIAKQLRTASNEKGKYTTGIITRFSAGSKGTRYMNYEFYVDNTRYAGFQSDIFCSDCKRPCCNIGDSVIVHFQKNDSKNCELVHELPE